MVMSANGLLFLQDTPSLSLAWEGPMDSVAIEPTAIQAQLLNLDAPCYVVKTQHGIGLTNRGRLAAAGGEKPGGVEALIAVPPCRPQQLGDRAFGPAHGVQYAYAAGAMANGIAGEELVIALGKEKILSSFGAAGLPLARIEMAIQRIQRALPQGPYAFNVIHRPAEEAFERSVVDLYLRYGVRTVEASAFLELTPSIVYYRVAGLRLNEANEIDIQNKVIAKVSRREVAIKFLRPPPSTMLRELIDQRLVTASQAALAEHVPMADDITVEADSGGHTDNRPLVCLLPSILALRDEVQTQYQYRQPVRIGAAGGIGTPAAALAAFTMGAAYVVTGSINQACVEASVSSHTKQLLAEAEMTDVIMAPSADMFEMGVKVQVLKRGTLFPVRAQKLFDLYRTHDGIEHLPVQERRMLETHIFNRDLDRVWDDTVAVFTERDADQMTRVTADAKRKMALVFRWYLGHSARWSNLGEAGREIDYQIWCGPAMGAFNDWVQGSYLSDLGQRCVAEVSRHIMTGAAYLSRLRHLALLGLQTAPHYAHYRPVPMHETGRHLPSEPVPAPAPSPPVWQNAAAIQDWLTIELAEQIGLDPDDVDPHTTFKDYELDSAQVMVLSEKLQAWLGRSISPILMWNYPTIEALSQRLAETELGSS